MITATKDVQTYANLVMESRALLENLTEFFDSLPAPDENEDVAIDYPQLGTINEVHSLLTQVSEMIDEFDD